MRAVGQISYGLYVFTFPIWQLSEGFFHGGGDSSFPAALLKCLALDAVLFAATFALAWLTFRYIERPILKWKERFSSPIRERPKVIIA